MRRRARAAHAGAFMRRRHSQARRIYSEDTLFWQLTQPVLQKAPLRGFPGRVGLRPSECIEVIFMRVGRRPSQYIAVPPRSPWDAVLPNNAAGGWAGCQHRPTRPVALGYDTRFYFTSSKRTKGVNHNFPSFSHSWNRRNFLSASVSVSVIFPQLLKNVPSLPAKNMAFLSSYRL